jgi:Tfp pilus assembly major pilin PilA
MKSQRGITLMGLLVASIVVVFVAIGGLKIAPAYIEYFKVKKAVSAIAQGNTGGTVADVRTAFDRRAAVDDIDVIQGRDLEVSKDGNELVVSANYTKQIPLFANISVVINFAASSAN